MSAYFDWWDGQRIAALNLAPNSTTVHIFDISSGDESIEPIPWPSEAAPPRVIAFTADDRTLLIGDQEGGIREIDVATRTVSPSRFEGMHGPVVSLYPLPDGGLLAVSARRHDVDLRRHIGPAARTTNGLGAGCGNRPVDVAGNGLPTSRTQPHARRVDSLPARRRALPTDLPGFPRE